MKKGKITVKAKNGNMYTRNVTLTDFIDTNGNQWTMAYDNRRTYAIHERHADFNVWKCVR